MSKEYTTKPIELPLSTEKEYVLVDETLTSEDFIYLDDIDAIKRPFSPTEIDTFGGMWLGDSCIACVRGIVNISSYREVVRDTNIEAPEEPEAFDIMAQDNEQLQNYEMDERVEWDGEGLPPVGEVCELKYKHATNANWRKCKVFAYSNDYGDAAAVWHLDGDTWYHHSINISEYEFRKPETQQQREERERLEAAFDLYLLDQLGD